MHFITPSSELDWIRQKFQEYNQTLNSLVGEGNIEFNLIYFTHGSWMMQLQIGSYIVYPIQLSNDLYHFTCQKNGDLYLLKINPKRPYFEFLLFMNSVLKSENTQFSIQELSYINACQGFTYNRVLVDDNNLVYLYYQEHIFDRFNYGSEEEKIASSFRSRQLAPFNYGMEIKKQPEKRILLNNIWLIESIPLPKVSFDVDFIADSQLKAHPLIDLCFLIQTQEELQSKFLEHS
ncbi:MAG: hypothetical protein ACRCXZ_01125 [Patescibacteria group bacterium]